MIVWVLGVESGDNDSGLGDEKPCSCVRQRTRTQLETSCKR
jgi:hypothetical protein